MKSIPDLSIIIVNYNTCDLTLVALKSVFESKTNYTYEVYLIDNGSKDDSVSRISSKFSNVKIIKNSENLGFAKANNQAIREARGRYILLLNSDTEISAESLQVMLDFMEEHRSVGASGCKIVLPDGTLDKACKRGFPTPLASFFYAIGLAKRFPNHPKINYYHLGHLNPDEMHEVDCLVGAFMLIRREAIEQVGLLDEDYFMYGEDIDYCYRLKQAGWKIMYYPYTTILHHKGASSRNKPFKIIYEFHRAMILFYRKHYIKKYSWLITVFMFIGIGINFMLAVLMRKFMPVK